MFCFPKSQPHINSILSGFTSRRLRSLLKQHQILQNYQLHKYIEEYPVMVCGLESQTFAIIDSFERISEEIFCLFTKIYRYNNI